MDDIVIISLITILYGLNVVAVTALYNKINRIELIIARMCGRFEKEGVNYGHNNI